VAGVWDQLRNAARKYPQNFELQDMVALFRSPRDGRTLGKVLRDREVGGSDLEQEMVYNFLNLALELLASLEGSSEPPLAGSEQTGPTTVLDPRFGRHRREPSAVDPHVTGHSRNPNRHHRLDK
jgi:hypothetical protein